MARESKMKPNAVRAALILAATLAASAATAGEITVRVTGFAGDAGAARIILMPGEAGYRGEVGLAREVSVPISGGVAHWRADDLAPGSYALIAHHDRNANGDLDRPVLTLPLEPYGYSNGAWTSFGLPPYEEVAFTVSEAPVFQAVHLRVNAFVAAGQMLLVGLPSLFAIFGGLALFRRWRAGIAPGNSQA